jgi:DNA-binding response OmpR family regulator
MRILLVEDHADTQNLMSRLLRMYQHDVMAAGNVREALKLADANPFDLVISDLGLPDGSGAKLMSELRIKYGLKGIALSGTGDDGELHEALQSGFVAHLTKPIDFDKLRDTITRVGT